jgi:hypothetical protein
MFYILLTIPATLFLAILISGCSFAPFSSTHSAHTLEKNAIDVQGGVTGNTLIPYVRVGYGSTENMELGLLTEAHGGLISGVFGKYAFVNNKEKGSSFSIQSGSNKIERIVFNVIMSVIDCNGD